MNFDEVSLNIKNGVYRAKMEYPRNRVKFKEDHVFDENLSVKRNREMVKEANQKVNDELDEYRKSERDWREQFKTDVRKAIMSRCNITESAADVIRVAAEEKYDEFGDVLDEAENLCYIFNDIMKENKKK